MLPDEITNSLDYDRIKENIEDFVSTDRYRELALNPNILKPMHH